MANRVQALKRVRQAERRTAFNRFARTRLRHQIRTMRRALGVKEHGGAKEHGDLKTIMNGTFSLIDRAARKGYIKSGTAARYKSRIHKRVKVALGDVAK
jgi:small subunit ribosomal protein S20